MRLALVLHAHLPWVRRPEPWTTEERWLHEALWECYLPLLAMEQRLAAEGVTAPFTLSLSPSLLAMWEDDTLRARFAQHLGAVQRLNDDVRARWPIAARHYDALLGEAATVWAQHGRGLARAFGDHHRAGRLELLTTAATHALLPALAPRPDAIEVQLGLGRDVFTEATGVEPAGMWLPECAFNPEVDLALARLDVSATVVAEHAVRFARPDPGDLARGAPTPVITPRGVGAVPRHREATLRVWSPTEGYPGHPDYREFHRDLGHDLPADVLGPLSPGTMTGLKVHRIGAESLYDPERGAARARHDAEDLLGWLARRRLPLCVMAFDAELFGHWWHEGIVFLEHLLRRAARAGIEPVTLSAAVRDGAWPVAEPAESTWGRDGGSRTWLGPSTASHWRLVHAAWREVTAVWREGPRDRDAALRATRAALLLQASDWTFLVDAGASASWARGRVASLAEAVTAWTARARGRQASVPEPLDAPFADDLIARHL